MTDKIEKPRPFNARELYELTSTSRLNATAYSAESKSNGLIAVRMQGIEAELSAMRQDMADLKGIFGRIATAMEEANEIKRAESAPPKKAAGTLGKIEKK